MILQISKAITKIRKHSEPGHRGRGIGHKGTIKPFDLKINKGEVIGLTGLLGSGRSELVRSIYGAIKLTAVH